MPRILLLLAILAIAVRIAASLILAQPLESDALDYFTMAKNLAERGILLDQFGQQAFFSAGYPLLLTPAFRLLGSSVGVALAVNLLLALVSLWLVWRLTTLLSANRLAAFCAAGGYTLWLPAIWNASLLAKENLSTPLLLGLSLCAVKLARGEQPWRNAALAGLLWGASLITGGSALLLCQGIGVALLLLWQRDRLSTAIKAGLLYVTATLVALAPWFYATNMMVGRPLLTTNAAFNLYLGNNPAANGYFVSIAETPLGAQWEAIRAERGELGTAELLQAEATAWIRANPLRAVELGLHKLAYFWQPNLPDAADFVVSPSIALIRLIEVAQYLLIIMFSLLALRVRQITTDGKWVFASMIIGFWLIHAAAYIILRYRDPIMPLLICLAAIPVAGWWQGLFAGKR
jgi:hypothetical protein